MTTKPAVRKGYQPCRYAVAAALIQKKNYTRRTVVQFVSEEILGPCTAAFAQFDSAVNHGLKAVVFRITVPILSTDCSQVIHNKMTRASRFVTERYTLIPIIHTP